MQARGRGRAINRTAIDPLKIDVLTNVVLPMEVDEVTSWDLIQPTLAEIMRARGALPINYADMATAYPDLFYSRDAAKMALTRENPEQIAARNRRPADAYGIVPGGNLFATDAAGISL